MADTGSNEHSGQALPSPEKWRKAMLFHNRWRTRLSNERTFLSWVRTSLTLITLGFVVQRFELFLASEGLVGAPTQSPAFVKWVPMLFFFLGGAIIVLGTYEFFRVRSEIAKEGGKQKSHLRDVLVVTTLLFLLTVSVIFVVSMP